MSYASEAEAPIYIKIRMRQWVGDVEGVSDKRIPPSCSKPQWDENVHLENPDMDYRIECTIQIIRRLFPHDDSVLNWRSEAFGF